MFNFLRVKLAENIQSNTKYAIKLIKDQDNPVQIGNFVNEC